MKCKDCKFFKEGLLMEDRCERYPDRPVWVESGCSLGKENEDPEYRSIWNIYNEGEGPNIYSGDIKKLSEWKKLFPEFESIISLFEKVPPRKNPVGHIEIRSEKKWTDEDIANLIIYIDRQFGIPRPTSITLLNINELWIQSKK